MPLNQAVLLEEDAERVAATFNARAEMVHEQPMFHASFKRRRFGNSDFSAVDLNSL